MESKKLGILQIIKNNAYAIKIVFKISPVIVFFQVFFTVLSFVKDTFYYVYFMRFLMNSLQLGSPLPLILTYVAISVILLGLFDYLYHYQVAVFNAKTQPLLARKLDSMLFEKSADVELACYEDEKFYNEYTQSVLQIKEKVMDSIYLFGECIGGIIELSLLAYIMISLDFITIGFAVFPLFVGMLLGPRAYKRSFNFGMKNVQYERQKGYVQRTVYFKDYAKEIRNSNIFVVMKDKFRQAYEGLNYNLKKYSLPIAIYNFLYYILTDSILYYGALIYVFYRVVVSKNMLIGDYIVLLTAITNMNIKLTQFFETTFSGFSLIGLFIQKFRTFLDYKPKIHSRQTGLVPHVNQSELTFNNVSFGYNQQTDREGNPAFVLKNINLQIKPYEKIALVGINGAGKSTLIKLIMRLYDPSEGTVTLNGVDIQKYDVEKYRDQFGTIFQDYQIFSLTVKDNVLLGNESIPKEMEEAVVEDSLELSGALQKIKTLGKGIDSMLTREFDDEGYVLSGGEHQKIAIARTFAKPCSIVILDEPSSALDPIAEHTLFQNMMKVCEDKAVIIISHRLSSTAMADRIYLLDDGRIIEQGSHQELMKAEGKYAEMFRMQATQYSDEAVETV